MTSDIAIPSHRHRRLTVGLALLVTSCLTRQYPAAVMPEVS